MNPFSPNRVVIDKDQYHKLKRAQAMLRALEAGGVDNWDWHSEAIRDYRKSIKGQPWDNEDHDDD